MSDTDNDVLDWFIKNEAARQQYLLETADEVDVVDDEPVVVPAVLPPERKTQFRQSLARLSNRELDMLLRDLYAEIVARGIDSPPAPCPV